MNIAAIIATIGLAVLTANGITGGFSRMDDLMFFFNGSGIFIVLGGTLVSAVYASSVQNIIRLMKVIPEVFKAQPERMVNTLVLLVDITKIARKNVLAVENILPKVKNQFMKDGLQLVVDRVDRQLVEKILISEMINLDRQQTADAKMVKFLSTVAPTWGMIGTLFGLVFVLKDIATGPESIGAGMALAILTTLYGAILSTGLFLPWYNKLIEKRDEERLYYQMIKEGILAVESNQRPELLEQDLKNYLNSELRQKYEELKFSRQKRKSPPQSGERVK